MLPSPTGMSSGLPALSRAASCSACVFYYLTDRSALAVYKSAHHVDAVTSPIYFRTFKYSFISFSVRRCSVLCASIFFFSQVFRPFAKAISTFMLPFLL